MKIACRQISSKAACLFAHETRSLTIESSILTKKEKDQISALPFFDKASYASPKSRGNSAKQEYLKKKLSDVRKVFGYDSNNPGYLPFKLPKERPNPYLDAHLGRTIDPDTGKQILHGKHRLSVTKLLTKRWCELRESYDIYAKAPIFEHAHVVKGLETHQKLEGETHPIPEGWRDFVEDFEITIPTDEFHELVGSWYENMVRLTNLFIVGEAREVLCHGYLNSDSCQLVEGPVTREEDILISGVIDHLFLVQRGYSRSKPLRINGCIVRKPTFDITDILKQLSADREHIKQNYEVVVSDVKTRSIRKVPTQNSVLKSTKLQVMYYRSFMETLGSSVIDTYEKLLTNAQRRGMDVDKPIEPSKIVSIMAAGDLIISDMRRLRDGDDIGFEPFDNCPSESVQTEAYDVTHFHDLITDMRVIQKFEEFFVLWSKPPTLRYFAARLAQLYHEIAPLLSDTLLVEYYYKGENFHNIYFDYDRRSLASESFNSGRFWFEKRDIEPIEPTLKNVMTYCKYCDYEEVCLWKKQAVERCRGLGDDLTKMAKI